MNNTNVESWLQDGCGRCELFATPGCKVHLWTDVLISLRTLLRETRLHEEMKWGFPCYTVNGRNVVMLTAMKDCCALSFLEGAALSDPEGVLVSPGPNSRYARYVKFTSVADLERLASVARRLLHDAIALAESGVKFVPVAEPEPLPDELLTRLEADPELLEAFERLTPGRRRSHTIYVSGAKGTEARARRVEKCVPKIMAGMGFLDR